MHTHVSRTSIEPLLTLQGSSVSRPQSRKPHAGRMSENLLSPVVAEEEDKKRGGGDSTPSRTSAGLATTVLDTAIALTPLPRRAR